MKGLFRDPNGSTSSLRIFFLFWGVFSFIIYFCDWLFGWQRVDLMGLAAILSAPALGIAVQHVAKSKSENLQQTHIGDDVHG